MCIHYYYIRQYLRWKRDKKSPHELFYKEKPKIIKNLLIFGEIGIVKSYKMKSKLQKKGNPMIFIGYPEGHSSSSFRMFNVETGGICISRDIYWLNKNYKQWKNGQSVIDNVITNTSLISLENINEVQANKSGVNNEINTSKSTDYKSK